jgi:hypothetical protein
MFKHTQLQDVKIALARPALPEDARQHRADLLCIRRGGDEVPP